MLSNKLNKTIQYFFNNLIIHPQFYLKKSRNFTPNLSIPRNLLSTIEKEKCKNQKACKLPELCSMHFESSMRFIQFCRKDQPGIHTGVVSKCGKKLIEFPKNSKFLGDMINFMNLNLNHQQLNNFIKIYTPEDINDDIYLLPPITNPENIICIENNYNDYPREGCKNSGPIFYNKLPNSLIGPSGSICCRSFMSKLSYGINLAIIIEKEGNNIPIYEVYDHIFGYTIAQNISACYWWNNKYVPIKSADTFCPLGPCIIHKSVIDNPQNLSLLCKINNKLKQIDNTNNMIYNIEEIVCEASKCFTLKPGDIILTGSPEKIYNDQNEIEYLKDEDFIMSEIQYIGKLMNRVITEKEGKDKN